MADDDALILCIDDDPDILGYLKIVLESEGFRFTGAASAEEGLRAYDATRPDLVIVDLMMEEVDSGTTFAKELLLRENTAPVFLLSSVGDNLNLTADYNALGLAGVFQKPLAKEPLLAVILAKLKQAG